MRVFHRFFDSSEVVFAVTFSTLAFLSDFIVLNINVLQIFVSVVSVVSVDFPYPPFRRNINIYILLYIYCVAGGKLTPRIFTETTETTETTFFS